MIVQYQGFLQSFLFYIKKQLTGNFNQLINNSFLTIDNFLYFKVKKLLIACYSYTVLYYTVYNYLNRI